MFSFPEVVLDPVRIGELGTVVQKENGKELFKIFQIERFAEPFEPFRNGGGVVAVTEIREYEFRLDEVDRQKDFPAFPSFYGIALDYGRSRMLFQIGLVVRVCPADPALLVYFQRPRLFSCTEPVLAWSRPSFRKR